MNTLPTNTPCEVVQEPDKVKTNLFSDAGSPFDDADADVIVRSYDCVDFFLYRIILAKASAVFAEMLQSAQEDATFRNGLYIIHAMEDAKTLSSLFRLIYPVDNPAFAEISEIKAVFKAMRKYRVRGLDWTANCILQGFASEAPEVVYAIACGFQMPNAARFAAKHTLRQLSPFLPLTDEEVSMMTALQYSRLLRYQSACRDVALSIVDQFILEIASKTSVPWIRLSEASNGAKVPVGCRCVQKGYQARGKAVVGPEWFFTHVAECRATLSKSPLGNMVMAQTLSLSNSIPCACPGCCKIPTREVWAFAKAFGAAVDRVVEAVRSLAGKHSDSID
ncbi:hypothetical protein DENSPDRAFT_922211 [Dentipellis sp. KUC8613]|nr:hypothetical protein DENSPDRAFT_922211 [Dentipellis sp. KUC8613]